MDSNILTTILTTVGAVLALIGGVAGLLYRGIQQSHNQTVTILLEQIKDLQERLDRALGVAEGQAEVTKELVRTTRTNQRRS